MSFNNKVVLVTGGSSGIGASTAIFFAREGAEVAIVGNNEVKLKIVADKISKVGKAPLIIKADITKMEETRTVIKNTIEKFGRLDVLVNNAGIIRYAEVFDDNLLEVYDEIMNTNLSSIVLLVNLSAPYLIKSKGNVVNVSSVGGSSAASNKSIGLASYCTLKARLDHFSRVAALELAAKGVRVNVVSPGPIETDIFENDGRDVNWSGMVPKTPLNILTQAKEIADMILFLASNKAKSITGGSFTVDGGVNLTL